MLVDSEIRHLSVPLRFAAFAEAYRSAAAALCSQMIGDAKAQNWPNATVVLMLASHAVELFLKAALHYRPPASGIEHHDIYALSDLYAKNFPEPSFTWEIPFKVEFLGMNDEEIREAKRRTPMPSMLYRYPINKGSSEWNAALGFVPSTFLLELERMREDFERLREQFT